MHLQVTLTTSQQPDYSSRGGWRYAHFINHDPAASGRASPKSGCSRDSRTLTNPHGRPEPVLLAKSGSYGPRRWARPLIKRKSPSIAVNASGTPSLCCSADTQTGKEIIFKLLRNGSLRISVLASSSHVHKHTIRERTGQDRVFYQITSSRVNGFDALKILTTGRSQSGSV